MTVPEELVLDFHATDNPLYGQQEGRFFHGYYDCYCYLPLYEFCGQQLLCAYLRAFDESVALALNCIQCMDRALTPTRPQPKPGWGALRSYQHRLHLST